MATSGCEVARCIFYFEKKNYSENEKTKNKTYYD